MSNLSGGSRNEIGGGSKIENKTFTKGGGVRAKGAKTGRGGFQSSTGPVHT